jgi:hypothetical protein
MAKVNTFDKFFAVRPSQGNAGAFNQKDRVVAASTSIKRGDIVSLSSGEVVQAIALPGANSTKSDSGGNLPVLGVAMADIVTGSGGTETGTGRSTIPVAIFDGNLELALRIYHATPGSAEARDLTLSTAYQFARWRGASADEWWYALIPTTTNGELKYVERSAESEADDDYGIVWTRAILSETVRQG